MSLLDIEGMVERDPIFGCDLWQGRTDKDGYPIRWQNARAIRMVTEAYEMRHGPIKPGFEVDHLCRRRLCLRDVHHELVTRSQNEQRKSWAVRARRKQCAAGHDLSVNGAITPEGGRTCRTCNRSGA